jgi:flagellar biosynthesis/type III secretory pathway protein FliH
MYYSEEKFMFTFKRSIYAGMILLALSGLTSCKKHYLEGFGDGEVQGYNNGYDDGQVEGQVAGLEDGHSAGWDAGELYFTTHDSFQDGFNDGEIEGLSIGYNNGYAVGFQDGLPIYYNAGYDDGNADGLVTGYNSGYSNGHYDGNAQGHSNGYADGYVDAYIAADADGYNDGYTDGYNADHSAAYTAAYNSGYNDGDFDGHDDGYYDGYNYGNGFDNGYNNGFNDGDVVGFNDGYDVGFDDGYDLGFDDGYDYGFDDGYYAGYSDGIWGFSANSVAAIDNDGLPNNNTANVNPFVNLAGKLQNDLVNYKRLKSIEQEYAKGIQARMLEETSASSKDLAKIATMKEQFRIKLVASELQNIYKLSADRSNKIAVLSTTWRKLANHRAITHEDAEKFGKQLIGMNLSDVVEAVEDSRKGNILGLNKILTAGAQVNKVSKAHMSAIIVNMFY